jgi:hypothetical protein
MQDSVREIRGAIMKSIIESFLLTSAKYFFELDDWPAETKLALDQDKFFLIKELGHRVARQEVDARCLRITDEG